MYYTQRAIVHVYTRPQPANTTAALTSTPHTVFPRPAVSARLHHHLHRHWHLNSAPAAAAMTVTSATADGGPTVLPPAAFVPELASVGAMQDQDSVALFRHNWSVRGGFDSTWG